ncbi:HD-GYP domain-containing protein [Curvibacter sp. CHRR-16]|uniref:HD-GYP domain-containing protein n=1 Tax=Curvibacter sp. CHRR-16 TaxID=2835872 RepID=UPI001BD9FEC5|nr:HD-GYP domain-containing protein [Curvibacter sp. CHRR-16]MBT0569276.1 HD-GYP domain-containing protein [Curvibacter sp. CHRR-16]
MRKKITTNQLRLGMYIQEFCGSWMDHPFWRSAFVLNASKDLQAIVDSRITEVWIDTSKGLDVEQALPESSLPATAAVQTEQGAADVLASEWSFPAPAVHTVAHGEDAQRIEPSSMQQELLQAAEICRQSKQAVESMFHEARMGKAVDATVARQLVQDITDSVTRNSQALISLARLKNADDYTYMHSVAVCALMVALSRQLGLDPEQTRQAGMAGLMHDLGKAHIPLDILNKPGKLTPAEFDEVKKHPQEGYDILHSAGCTESVVLDVCLHHHERVDGKGYPKGLDDSRISLFAKMGAVCDVYDAITSNRPYKQGWDPAESLKQMASWAKGHFDQRVFQAFVKSLGIYPVGSLVRLQSGAIAVVVEQNPDNLTAPKVKKFFSTKSDMRVPAALVDLANPDAQDKIAFRENPSTWKFPDLHAMWAGDAAPHVV